MDQLGKGLGLDTELIHPSQVDLVVAARLAMVTGAEVDADEIKVGPLVIAVPLE